MRRSVIKQNGHRVSSKARRSRKLGNIARTAYKTRDFTTLVAERKKHIEE